MSEEPDIYEALGAIINECESASKGIENSFFNSKYADLNALLAIVKPLCFAHNVTILQLPLSKVTFNDGAPPLLEVGSQLVLMHTPSGTEIRNTLVMPCVGLDPQKAGSGLSYVKRYQIKAVFMLQDDDDDGNNACKPTVVKKTALAPETPAGVDLDTVSMFINGAIDVPALNGVYANHIANNTNLSAEDKETATALCAARKQELQK